MAPSTSSHIFGLLFIQICFALCFVNTAQAQLTSSQLTHETNPMPLGPADATRGANTNARPIIYRPPQVPLDPEGYPEPPNGLELEQVHAYVRHGERAPVSLRLNKPPANIPESWPLCTTAHQATVPVYGLDENGVSTKGFLRTQKGVERHDGSIVENECLLGELTDIGRQTTYNYGKSLRKLYIDRLGLLPDKLSNTSQVYLRTTNIPRTTESLQQVLHGLYPDSKRYPGVLPTILVRNGKDENLVGNYAACKRLEFLQIEFAQVAAAAYNPTLEPLDGKLSKYLNGNGVRVDGKPRASGIMDTIRAAIAQGIHVPPEFKDPVIVDTIERAVVSEWFADKTEEVRRLGMGRLLDDLVRKMTHKIEHGKEDPLKLLVHVTHDTSLAALLQTLDAFDDQWPAFTASVVFELFSKPPSFTPSHPNQNVLARLKESAQSPAEQFIRMRYQNQNMVLPFCAVPGKHLEGHPELCTFAAFKERVKQLTPTDWEGECALAGRSAKI